ncbi:1-acyl-sn-glycerol-3-phosphate acyltransferase [Desulfovibrio ferrophilus]|uniref:1-acyl-sn-glycerol-3-phosphate acyltransferase n=2 Tax=Desulfovibrio ferrophilus TaxID=241368 RepID=A0A2Z6AUB6_9BACT|nr:1-acyl-sn-glycerol-3-phosphate acyltransferase [Desulfovibrio ferrophilus]
MLPLDVDLSELDPEQTYVFMANHQSQLDIPLLTALLAPRKVSFVAKQSLFKIPVFGAAIKAVGHISIDRSNRRRAMKSIESAVQKAQGGRSIMIYPEGTRAEDLDNIQEFKIGGVIIALKTGLPVVPIVLSGTGEVLPKHRLLLRSAPLKVKALPPIDTGKYTMKDREAFKDDLYKMMNDAYLEMRSD